MLRFFFELNQSACQEMFSSWRLTSLTLLRFKAQVQALEPVIPPDGPKIFRRLLYSQPMSLRLAGKNFARYRGFDASAILASCSDFVVSYYDVGVVKPEIYLCS